MLALIGGTPGPRTSGLTDEGDEGMLNSVGGGEE